jgi:hypothetical protein
MEVLSQKKLPIHGLKNLPYTGSVGRGLLTILLDVNEHLFDNIVK